MGVLKDGITLNKYRPGGINHKSGILTWRFVFCAQEDSTGTERTFFIDFIMLNPGVSPSESVLGYKSRPTLSPDDLQYALAGTDAAHNLASEIMVVPSYVVVKAGVLGSDAKQMCQYTFVKGIKSSNRSFNIDTGACTFTDEKITGSVSCSPSDVREHPEYLCDSGTMSWDVRFNIPFGFTAGFNGKTHSWGPVCTGAVFAGTVTLDGAEYHTVPKKSYGYIDRITGKDMQAPWFHLSAANLTSLISGKTMFDSNFAVQGEYDGRLSVLVNLEGQLIQLCADARKRSYETIWECTQMPEDENGDKKLHWSVSANNKLWVLDIDVFCKTDNLYIRSFEQPQGSRILLKILTGSTGTGEIRLYKHVKKNLELIEHAHIANALCEFGQNEEPEK